MKRLFYVLAVLAGIGAGSAGAQRIAVLAPEDIGSSRETAAIISESLSDKTRTVDTSLAEAAFMSVAPASPFNLTTAEARRIGVAIGTDAFVLIRSATQRRSAFQRSDYYESYAAIFVVSTRTGRLIMWRLKAAESPAAERSRQMLEQQFPPLADEIADTVRAAIKDEISASPLPEFEEPPDEGSPAARGFRAPVPYRRLKPDYTTRAALYDVKATVDLFVYLDAAGRIVRTEIDRWAGFGLDESVEANVRSMNWRPAERNGKPIAMKFLVRYNFKKPD